MQAFFILLGTLAVLIPGFFVASLFLPATVKVVHIRVIKAPLSLLFQQVNIPGNWERWSPWRRKGMAIIESRKDEYILVNLQFKEQRKARGYFRFQAAAGGTLITWGLVAEMGHNPGRRLMGYLMDRRLRKDFEKGLANLERLVKGI